LGGVGVASIWLVKGEKKTKFSSSNFDKVPSSYHRNIRDGNISPSGLLCPIVSMDLPAPPPRVRVVRRRSGRTSCCPGTRTSSTVSPRSSFPATRSGCQTSSSTTGTPPPPLSLLPAIVLHNRYPTTTTVAVTSHRPLQQVAHNHHCRCCQTSSSTIGTPQPSLSLLPDIVLHKQVPCHHCHCYQASSSTTGTPQPPLSLLPDIVLYNRYPKTTTVAVA
jgi:hypothetical protein